MAGELLQPHHGGSPTHVATPAGAAAASPPVGAATTLRVEVPHASGYAAVHLRSVEDGEPVYRRARRVQRSGAVDVHEVDLPQVSPAQSYRFQLEGPHGDAWLTGRGLVPHDVTDNGGCRLLAPPPPPTRHAGPPR